MSESVFACALQRAYVAHEVVMEFAQISVRVLVFNQHLQGGAEGVETRVKRVMACHTQPAWNWPRLDWGWSASWRGPGVPAFSSSP